ncbi:GntR family transcriptional regulator [Phytopseudomonas dryadis]|uniref:GntR family transcriptional regulator n=1 Tax=Pseudomonadaceae TaxID=135621 RepID=UPI001A955313|nr:MULTISPECIES: GntR family transcriptional regulator [Pseudomonas]
MEPTVKRVVDTLEEEIVLGFLHPRERLVEDELLSRFQLKRHVVRQVLVELERMGLVERKRNVGALVKAYSVEEVEHLYAVRELLESHGVAMIRLPLPAERLEPLIEVQRQHDAAVAAGDLRRTFRLNVTFHRELFSLSDNPVLVEAIQAHAQRAHSIRASTMVMPQQLERARLEHWQIIEALGSGDRERLMTLCRDHLKPSRDAYIEAYRRRSQGLQDGGATRRA